MANPLRTLQLSSGGAPDAATLPPPDAAPVPRTDADSAGAKSVTGDGHPDTGWPIEMGSPKTGDY